MHPCCQSSSSLHPALLSTLLFCSSSAGHLPSILPHCLVSHMHLFIPLCVGYARHSLFSRSCASSCVSALPTFSCMRAAVHGIGGLIRCGCCRGRAERMAFADSFVQAYHFRLLYLSSAMMYPIMGAMRHSYGKPWQVNKFPFVIACKCVKWSSALSRDVLETGGYCS